jgi:carotenoid cleavage dioxygenase-like enzyme
VMPRTGTNADVTWHEIDPCYVFHPVSSYEDGDRIVLTVCRSEGVMQNGFDDLGAMAQLWRWTIDRTTGKVHEEQLDDRRSDFPRIDDRRIGQSARYGYTAELTWEGPATIGSELYKYDLMTGVAEVHTTSPRTRLGEAVFAPAGPAAAEDEGWVLVFAHDEAEDRTELRIIDAQDFSGPPVARVRLPRRVPYGAHGAWLPAV